MTTRKVSVHHRGNPFPGSRKITKHINFGMTEVEYTQVVILEKKLYGEIDHARLFREILSEKGIVFRERETAFKGQKVKE